MEICIFRDTEKFEKHNGCNNDVAIANMYVIRGSQQYVANPYGIYQIIKKPTKSEISCPRADYEQWKRRKRIARYKMYAVEGKVKDSFKKSIRWIKRSCRKIVYGF